MTTLTIAAQDSITMLWRELKHTLRFPLLLVGSILVPVVMMLLFVYILGGPIGAGLGDAARGAPYVDFLVPGILMMTVAAGSGTTAINVCIDMTGGIVDRFRTMPVTQGAVLVGHVGGSVLRTLVTTAVVTGVALLVGFRPQASVMDWFAVVGIVASFSFALASLSAALGLVAKSVAGANGATLPIQFLLPFLSSAFVPADSMPAGVRWFTPHQPFTAVVESLRALLTGAPAASTSSTTRRSIGPRKTRASTRWPIAPRRGSSPTDTAGPPAESRRIRPSQSWSRRRPARRRRPGTGSPRSRGSAGPAGEGRASS